MKYNCIIKHIDEEEIEITIDGVTLFGFCNCGLIAQEGENRTVDIEFYDEILLNEAENSSLRIVRHENNYAYSIFGILDIDNGLIHSEIDFQIDRELLYDYCFLDKKRVELKTQRIDMTFTT